MKINILKEGVFKTPTQARAAREKEQSKSSTERLAATAVEIQNNNIIKIVNDTIERHNIPLFPKDFLTHMQYYSLDKVIQGKIFFPRTDVISKYEKDDLRLLKVRFESDKLIFTINVAFPVIYNKYSETRDTVPICMGFVDNKLIFTDESIEQHKKYFLCAIKHWLEDDYAHDKVDDSALKIIEYIENDKVEFDKIHLFAGYDNIYFAPSEKVQYSQYESGTGKFINTSAVKYGSWLGAISIMRLGKFLAKHFVFDNAGKLGFLYTHDQQGIADMSVINDPSLKKYTDDFVSAFLTLSNENFKKFMEEEMKEGGYTNKYYRDGEFVIPRRDDIQITKWLRMRQAAIDNGLIKIENITREIVTYGAIIDIDKETGNVSIGDDFHSNNGAVRINAVIYLTLAGIPEEIAISQISYIKLAHGFVNNAYFYCSDMGVTSLKKGTQTDDSYTREVYKFPNSSFPVLYANSEFMNHIIDTLRQRTYEVDAKTITIKNSPLDKVGKDFVEILYLEATGEDLK